MTKYIKQIHLPLNLMLIFTVCVASACSSDASGVKGDEPWDRDNDPNRFLIDLETNLDALPQSGRASHVAWPSTYWPYYTDSINWRWLEGDMSPAEKYDKAFNGWNPDNNFMALVPFDRSRAGADPTWDPEYYDKLGPLAAHVSETKGNYEDRTAALASPNGRPDQWPVESWWGLCHAWVRAALLEDRPLSPVVENGVRFEVGDIEALLIAAYDKSPAQYIGRRCNEGSGDNEVLRDERGRAINSECRDTNAGSMHLILSNYLGIHKKGFTEDRTYDYQVWNQPVVAFEVQSMNEISSRRANRVINAERGREYQFNADAVEFREVVSKVTYLSESEASVHAAAASGHEQTDTYHYVLELGAAGEIIGGEWAEDSRDLLPDFLWLPQRNEESAMPHLDLDIVRRLVAKSRQLEQIEGPADVALPRRAHTVKRSVTISDGGTMSWGELAIGMTRPAATHATITLEHNGTETTQTFLSDAARSFVIDLADFHGSDVAGEWNLSITLDPVEISSGVTFDGHLNGWGLRYRSE